MRWRANPCQSQKEMRMPTQVSKASSSEVAIFGRILGNGKRRITPALGRYILALGFSESDQDRMNDLATRNQKGELTVLEKEELFNYVRASHLLALLHSKARLALKKQRRS